MYKISDGYIEGSPTISAFVYKTDENSTREELGYFCGFYHNTKITNCTVVATLDDDNKTPIMLKNPWSGITLVIENNYHWDNFEDDSDIMKRLEAFIVGHDYTK